MFKTLFKNLCPIKVLTSSRGGHALLSTEVTGSTAGQHSWTARKTADKHSVQAAPTF